MRNVQKLIFAFAIGASLISCGDAAPPPRERKAGLTSAPDSFRVAFETSKGRFVVQVNRSWSRLGADRFYQLVDARFFDGNKFFRVIPGFVAQFGINGNPKINEPWDVKRLPDDPVTQSNTRGTLTFATQGPETRTHQMFINLVDNVQLDGMGFSPLGRVVEGMAVVDSLYAGYAEQPDQLYIQTVGNAYLERTFPKLDYVKSARIIE